MESYHAIGEEQPNEGRRIGHLGKDRHENRRPDVENAQHFLSGEVAIRYHAHEEGRYDRSNAEQAVGKADHRSRLLQPLAEIGPQSHEPSSPSKVLEEHHY